jgi:hypothetical protein
MKIILLFLAILSVLVLHEGLTPFAWEDVGIKQEEQSFGTRLAIKAAPLLMRPENHRSYYLFQKVELVSRHDDNKRVTLVQLPYGKWYRY